MHHNLYLKPKTSPQYDTTHLPCFSWKPFSNSRRWCRNRFFSARDDSSSSWSSCLQHVIWNVRTVYLSQFFYLTFIMVVEKAEKLPLSKLSLACFPQSIVVTSSQAPVDLSLALFHFHLSLSLSLPPPPHPEITLCG